MIELARLFLLLAIAAAGMTFAGSAIAWWSDEGRRMARISRRVLGGRPEGLIVARGRGGAAAFRLASEQVLVMRNWGRDALLYRLHALTGAELIVDDHVAARVMRDEPRRVLDQVNPSASRVTLRLVFDDPRHPDFNLDLWIPEDARGRDARSPSAAIRDARAWLGRAEAIIRRTPPPAAEIAKRPEPVTSRPAPWEDDPADDLEGDGADTIGDEGVDPDDNDPPRLL